ncbi:hypothetical protein SERLA73DRAFT_72605 [Serpula lacrymans var. lacrymans S7.3]|uniref:Uncharacterized protein n=2 Tax=Serpula lacrymans var. lacrymans TaxID=341189 RepID=F8PVK3_SERL3|nr:uncharacterized protein SERLADRAFT_437141 [Serpula lacrymans var. lacrymans S7.9]EGN99820.1 hypothetical protein SERLA73DRAFT_72605 [Serpula lacrymans var. lacrymans S7.3]EGO25390.1 hypothetical protein SERLADRAFT_437141 [Serpula lacrymans var. lacrymans S7.9]
MAYPHSVAGSQEGREMSRNQRDLVDTCFEEGQYESGIQTLEQLRSLNLRPSVSHIRQLLYIALYPPPPETADKRKEKGQVSMSPIKSSPNKNNQQQRSTHIPSPDATAAAQSLLTSFALTNSPISIYRALPQYGSHNDVRSSPDLTGEEDDSIIARESACIVKSKHCWAILKERFIQRKQLSVMSKKGNRKSRSSYIYDHEEEASVESAEPSPLSSVADHVWPVLDWLIILFENDESLTEDVGLPRHSPLLLSQIPPPVSGGARCDVDAPLDIVWYSLMQSDHMRKTMGSRIMSLLINLMSSTHFDTNTFVTSVAARLFSSTPDFCNTFFSCLPASSSVLTFKVALCRKYLAGVSTNAGPEQSNHRPKPQARAIRSARRSSTSQVDFASSTGTTNLLSVSNKSMLPSATEIMQLSLIEYHETGLQSGHAQLVRAKYEILLAYGTLKDALPTEQKDSEWQAMVSKGRLEQAITLAFPQEGEGCTYREALLATLNIWRLG